jgi:hypothetical protein
VEREYPDFWDRVLAFVDQARDECSEMAGKGRLSEFEKDWYDPISKVQKTIWFAEARPTARKIAVTRILTEIKSVIGYYRFAEIQLDADFG